MTPQDGDTPSSESSPPAPVLSRSVVIPNKRGLHARAAAKFVMLAERFDASVDVIREGQSVPARSIMGLMMLGAAVGDTIIIHVRGENAEEALEQLASLVEERFGED